MASIYSLRTLVLTHLEAADLENLITAAICASTSSVLDHNHFRYAVMGDFNLQLRGSTRRTNDNDIAIDTYMRLFMERALSQQ